MSGSQAAYWEYIRNLFGDELDIGALEKENSDLVHLSSSLTAAAVRSHQLSYDCNVAAGLLPIDAISAKVQRHSNGYLIFVTRRLRDFIYGSACIIAGLLPTKDDSIEVPPAFSFEVGGRILNGLFHGCASEEDQDLAVGVIDSIRAPIAFSLIDASLKIVVAHEIAHICHGHLEPKRRTDVESKGEEWDALSDEFTSDDLALKLIDKAWPDGSSESVLVGAVFLFCILDGIEILQGGVDRKILYEFGATGSHPECRARLSHLVNIFNTEKYHLEKMKECNAVFSTVYKLIGEAAALSNENVKSHPYFNDLVIFPYRHLTKADKVKISELSKTGDRDALSSLLQFHTVDGLPAINEEKIRNYMMLDHRQAVSTIALGLKGAVIEGAIGKYSWVGCMQYLLRAYSDVYIKSDDSFVDLEIAPTDFVEFVARVIPEAVE